MPSAVDTLEFTEDSDEVVEITEAFIVGDGDAETITTDPLTSFIASLQKSAKSTSPEGTFDVLKSVVGSQQILELPAGITEKVVPPPYNPAIPLFFLQMDEVVHRAVMAKAYDSVGVKFNLVHRKAPDGQPTKNERKVKAELEEIRTFIENCNEAFGFTGVLTKTCMDMEAVGWGAIEVIRGADMKIKKIDHVPAQRIQVARGWEYFVESFAGEVRYYQPFGRKVVSKTRRQLDGKPASFDPRLDGGPPTAVNAQFNLIDATTGQGTENFLKSANEILWFTKHHPATVYYGVSDSVPARSQILGNIHIREYLLQFFEHNTVPRYAIIVKGANLSPEVRDAILSYFQTNIKGRAHKTLFIPIPSVRGNIEVKFEKLDMGTENSFFKDISLELAHSIGRAHGVPSAILGFSEAASLGSGKGTAQNQMYKDRVITPLQEKFSTAINAMFSKGLGVSNVDIIFNPLDIRDREAEARLYGQLFDRGSVTINQVIEAFQLGKPIEGGDRAFIKFGNKIVFIDELPGMESGDIGEDEPPAGDNGAPGVPKTPDGNSKTKKGPENTPDNMIESQLSGKN